MQQFEVEVVEALIEGGPEKVWPSEESDPAAPGGWGFAELDESGVLTFQFDTFGYPESPPVATTQVRFVEVGKLLDALVRSDLTGLDRDVLRGVLQEALDAPAL